MTLETSGGEFRCTFVVRLTEKMNTLKENAFGLIIQKILGRLKNYASVL
jgi:hypothetical protein